MPDFLIPSLRGGLNEDPPTSLQDDQCTVALNVEFWASMLGERRLGGAAINLAGSPLAACERIVWMHRHLPTINPADAQFWAMGINGATVTLAYKDTAWHAVAMPDPMIVDGSSEYQVQGQSFNGKLFLAYHSAVDRLHVWDGATLRRTGLATSGAQATVADNGVAGTFTGYRYYRVRFTQQNASSVTVRRSEPNPPVGFNPVGTNSGANVTRPAPISEGETHWELEASVDNANYYRIATAPIATTTLTDTQLYARGYAQDFPLSEGSGEYENLPSVKLLTVEQDRLMGANLWQHPTTDGSTVLWTPVLNDPGTGNDERLPVASVNVLGLDANDGGALTCLGATVNGYVYTTKLSHTYQLTRSGLRAHAYEAICLTKQRGAIFGSLVEALDQTGNPSPFALDPDIGPWRIGPRGVEPAGADLRRTWETANIDATVSARGLYFPEKKQVHWWVATGAAQSPNLRLVLHTQEMRQAPDGMRRGWALWDGVRAGALACCLFADNIDTNGPRSNALVPFIGVIGNGLVWQTDKNNDDNGTSYHAAIRTKPYAHGSLMNQFEAHSAMLLAGAVPGGVLDVVLRGDFGLVETRVSGVTLDPVAGEMRVIKNLDDLGMAELRTVQVTFEDSLTVASRTASGTTQWSLEQFAVREVAGARA